MNLDLNLTLWPDQTFTSFIPNNTIPPLITPFGETTQTQQATLTLSLGASGDTLTPGPLHLDYTVDGSFKSPQVVNIPEGGSVPFQIYVEPGAAIGGTFTVTTSLDIKTTTVTVLVDGETTIETTEGTETVIAHVTVVSRPPPPAYTAQNVVQWAYGEALRLGDDPNKNPLNFLTHVSALIADKRPPGDTDKVIRDAEYYVLGIWAGEFGGAVGAAGADAFVFGRNVLKWAAQVADGLTSSTSYPTHFDQIFRYDPNIPPSPAGGNVAAFKGGIVGWLGLWGSDVVNATSTPQFPQPTGSSLQSSVTALAAFPTDLTASSAAAPTIINFYERSATTGTDDVTVGNIDYHSIIGPTPPQDGNLAIFDTLANSPLTVGSGNDFLIITVDEQAVNTGNGNSTILLHGGANVVNVGTGANFIIGGTGNDTFIFGGGPDLIAGGAGADKFVFETAALTAAHGATPVISAILDYDQGNTRLYNRSEGDQIDLSALLSTAFNHGNGMSIGSLVRAVESSDGGSALLQIENGTPGHWVTLAQLFNMAPGETVNVILDASLPAGSNIQVAHAFALDNTYVGGLGKSISVTPSAGVLANDTDPNGLTLSAVLLKGPTNGTMTLNPDGSFSYAPQAGFIGTDTFTYQATDASGPLESATVSLAVGVPSVTVTGTTSLAFQGGPPVALTPGFMMGSWSVQVADASTLELMGATVQITGGFDAGDVLATNTTGTAITQSYDPASGTLTLTGIDTLADYGAVLSFVTFQDSGTDTTTAGHPARTFTWIVTDNLSNSSAPISSQITIDRPPVATNDAASDLAGAIITVNTRAQGVLGNDTDPDNDTLIVTAVSGSQGAGTVGHSLAGTYGHLTLNADGTYSYAADNVAAIASATGSHVDDVFTYTASDGLGGAVNATLDITITRSTGAAPTVSSIATSGIGITNGNGHLDAGKTVGLTVTMSEAVTVAGGTPTLTLNDGGNATFDAAHSTSTSLFFTYTVAQGDNTNDLIVSALNLNGSTIQDAAGNNADLSGAINFNPAGTLQIDTHTPVAFLPPLQVWTTPEQQAEAVYTAFFARAGDAAGLNFWMGNLDAGQSIFDVALNFSKSAEAQNIYSFLKSPSIDDDGARVTFINSIYTHLFNRTSDSAGLNYWDNQLHRFQTDLENGVGSPAGVSPPLDAADYFSQRVGNFIMNIIGGAQNSAAGQDITTIQNKVTVATYFSDQLVFHNISYANNQPVTIDNQAHSLVASTDSSAGSVATQKAAVDADITSDLASHAGSAAMIVGLTTVHDFQAV
jgi:VCBS repeat-containing protein